MRAMQPAPHATSWYAATAGDAPAFPPLEGAVAADIAIIGGGFTGLSAALHLAEAGASVVLLEAERVGWGASGRNGGQLHSGQRRDQDWLEAHFGPEVARALWTMAEEAKALVHDLMARHQIDCEWRAGLIEAVHRRRLVDRERAYTDRLRRVYGYDAAEWLDRHQIVEATGSEAYFGGRRDAGAGHLHPLKFAHGLARAAAAAGARLYEGSAATRLVDGPRKRIETARGSVSSPIVVLAGNGHLEGIDAAVEARVMAINNYILATAPIGAGRPGGLIPGGEAVSDSRFVVHYWRPTPDGRILFGGGETWSRRLKEKPAAFVRRHLLRLYPQLAGAAIDYAWGGTLAITRLRLPCIREMRRGIYCAAGFSGQGVAIAPYAGKVVAQAILGEQERLERFARLPSPPFPGGRYLRQPLLVAAMAWYALRDRLF